MSDFEYDKCNIISCSVYEDGKCKTNTRNGCGKVKAYQQGREDTLKQFEDIYIHNIALDYERLTMPMLMNFWNEFSKLTNEQLKKMNTERPGEIKNE